MRKSKSYNYKLLMGMILGILLSVIGVKAASYLGSGSELVYDNSSSGLSSVNVQNALDEVYGKICPDNYVCLKKKSTLALGDYVKMTPTKSSYTTDTSKTGYTSTQTINPQELNLWRVIKINDDGTVEMISEHVSSTAVYFRGQAGYQNLVGYLNVLASQYENSAYTKGSRYFGYNGQTEYITDTLKADCDTNAECEKVESQGGGDTLYTTDYNLVNTTLGTRVATKPGTTSASLYWIASRSYSFYLDDEDYTLDFYYWDGRLVNTSGTSGSSSLYSYSSSSFSTNNNGNSLRPIVVLKSGLKYSGVGTEDFPMEISVS